MITPDLSHRLAHPRPAPVYQQNQVYDSLRVTTHETGHALGLPDTYNGPCSQLMSGGGPGPSCTNAYPDARRSHREDPRPGPAS